MNDPKIDSLKAEVEAAHQEFDMAVVFHEVWKPTAYDEDLRNRMGVSYAMKAFHVVRVALRREMLLALMRLWDKPKDTVRMESIARTLRDKSVIDALAAKRVARMGIPEAKDQMRHSLDQLAHDAIALVDKYSPCGSHYDVRNKLQTQRHERLAHRSKATAVTGASATDEEIEAFYLAKKLRP